MTEFYHELVVQPQCDPQLLAEYIETIYQDGLEIGNDSIILRSESGLAEVKKQIETFAQELRIPVKLTEEKKENSDWIRKYQESVRPIEIGKFYIHPSWNEAKTDRLNIVIDPALSFGSGHHATTYSCVEALSKYCTEGQSVLDVGCGSGILSIAASKSGAEVDMCDTDEQAVESAKRNFDLNDCTYRASWTGSVTTAPRSYGLVMANIISDVLKMLHGDLKAKLKPGGILILSGILDSKAQSVMDRFSDLECLEKIERDEWVTLVYRGANE